MSSHVTTSTRYRLPAMRGTSALGSQPLVWRLRLVIKGQLSIATPSQPEDRLELINTTCTAANLSMSAGLSQEQVVCLRSCSSKDITSFRVCQTHHTQRKHYREPRHNSQPRSHTWDLIQYHHRGDEHNRRQNGWNNWRGPRDLSRVVFNIFRLRPRVRFSEMMTNESVITWHKRVDCPSWERVRAWRDAKCEEIVRRCFFPDCVIRAD